MKVCLQFLMGSGILMMLFTPIGYGIHYGAIDATLTSAELADEAKLDIAQRLVEATNYWAYWLIAGGFVTIASWIGLLAGRRQGPHLQPCPPGGEK